MHVDIRRGSFKGAALALLALAIGAQAWSVQAPQPLAAEGRALPLVRADGSVWMVAAARGGTAVAPRRIDRLADVVDVAITQSAAFALKADGTVWSWRPTEPVPPSRVPLVESTVSLACGEEHCLALDGDGRVWAWGSNEHGQLGDGTRDDQPRPVPIEPLSDVVAIAAGAQHSLAVTRDGSAWAWGANDRGQLGDDSNEDSAEPRPVAGLQGVEAVAAGSRHSLAVLRDGTAQAWGANDSGQLGNGTREESRVPVTVARLTGVASITAGNHHSAAARSDGTLWLWGTQTVVGPRAAERAGLIPAEMADAGEIDRVAANGDSTLAYRSDGSLWLVTGTARTRLSNAWFAHTHKGTASSASFQVESGPPLNALLVVDRTDLTDADAAVKARLEALGCSVTLREARLANPDDTIGMSLVLISSTSEARDLDGRLRNVGVPIVTWEHFLFASLGMVDSSRRVHGGASLGDTVDITDARHPLAAGLSGRIRIADEQIALGWGLTSPNSHLAASIIRNKRQAVLFAFDQGERMPGLVAPERRVGLFLSDDAAAHLTSDGWALFDAAVRWATRTNPPVTSAADDTAATMAERNPATATAAPGIRPMALGDPVLLVVGNTTLSAGDSFVKTELETTLSFVVTVKLASAATAADATGKALVVLSSTSPNLDLTNKFRDVAVPVIVQAPGTFDDMNMTSNPGRALETQAGADLVITTPSHPIADGLTGTTRIATTAPLFIGWGTPSASGVKVATMPFPGNSNQAAIFAYEQGVAMMGLNAPNRRVGFGLHEEAMAHLTAEGKRLFDAAVRWATRTNMGPHPDAGPDKGVNIGNPLSLVGSVFDDGLPNPPGAVSVTWSKQSGPGTATFSTPNALSTSVTLSTEGSYVLRLTASDGALTGYDEVTVTVYAVGANSPPIVSAGPDQSMEQTSSVTLVGTVTDDGLPNPPGVLTFTWSKVSGPGTVTFGTPNAVSTTATFSVMGKYVLRLTASDSALSVYDDVVVTANRTVLLVVGNNILTLTPGDAWIKSRLESLGFAVLLRAAHTVTTADATGKAFVWISDTANNDTLAGTLLNMAVPVVVQPTGITDNLNLANTRGSDTTQQLTITTATHPLAAGLIGTVTVEQNAQDTGWGVPNGNAVQIASVPSNSARSVVFAYEAGVVMMNSFTAPHRRVFFGPRDPGMGILSADGKRLFDAIVLWLTQTNAAPWANAGPDLSLTLGATANLAGYVADDGLPSPPGVTSAAWSTVSGPGTVNFGNPNLSTTTATFSAAGKYVLKLTASDSVLSRFDLVNVTVSTTGSNVAPSVSAGVDQTVGLPGPAYLRALIADDGLPNPPAAVSVSWTKLSGSGNVTFSSPTTASTNASFSAPGVYILRATANDGAASSADDVQVTVLASSDVLLVVGNDAVLSPGDALLRARATALGHNVQVKLAAASSAADATGRSLVILSNSSLNNDLNIKFKDVTVPVIVMHTGIYDDMLLTDGMNRGNLPGNQLTIVTPSHPLAAGLTGTVPVSLASLVPASFAWGTPTASATRVASMPGAATQAPIFVYEAGASMYSSFIAPARRIGFGIDQTGLANLTSQGLALLDAALGWAMEKRPPALFVVGATPLSSSDAALKVRLENLGLAVTVVTGAASATADGIGKVLVVLSPSLDPATVDRKFRDTRVPIVVAQPSLFAKLGMTGATLNTDYGTTTGQSQVQIVNSTHALAAGLSGTQTVTSAADSFGWGRVPDGAKIATLVGNANAATVFGIEPAPPTARENVVWTNTVGVGVSGNNLVKTTLVDTFGDSGAVSTRAIGAGDGYAEFTATETNRGRMFGLSRGDTDQTHSDIDFAILLRDQTGVPAGQAIWIQENGVTKRNDGGSYNPGDVFRVSIEGGVVKYRKNGALLWTSTVAPTYPLLIDTSLYHTRATITNAVLWAPVPAESVTWTNPVNVTVSGSTLTKPSGATAGWNSGAVSSRAVATGDGYVEFIASGSLADRIVGLGVGDTGPAVADIDFGLNLSNGGWVYLVEDGVSGSTQLSAYAPGDRFRVAFESGVVKYYRNGAVFYTSTRPVKYPLRADATLYSPGAVVSDVVIAGLMPSAEPIVWTNAVGVAVSGNNLTKTAVGDGWGNGGAASTKAIPLGDGYVAFTAAETNKGRIFGLSRGDTNQTDADIDFGLLARGDGQLVVYENAVLRNGGPVGSYQPGDSLRVGVEGGVVKYRRNGTLLYTSGVTPTYPLLMDTAFWHLGGTITNAVLLAPVSDTGPPLPERRAGLFLGPNSAANFTAAGGALFDAAVKWALASDADRDGLDVLEEWRYGADPTNPDTNGDGLLDGASVDAGISPTSFDADGDGISNGGEALNGTDPFSVDTDRDGVADASDCFPLDATRWQCPAPVPGDTIPPKIRLTEPTNAILISTVPPNTGPVSRPGGPYSGATGQSVTFNGSASTDSDGGLVTTYSWNFGDGTPAGTGVQTSHTYSSSGTRTITLTVTDDEGATGNATATAYISVPQAAAWAHTAGVTVSPTSLMKNTGVNGWGDSGAASTRGIASGDGYVEFSVPVTNKAALVGLSHGDTDQGFVDIDFGILAREDGQVWVYENGTTHGPLGAYQPNDLLRVAVESGTVKYRKNGALLYTSLIAPTYPLFVDTALYSSGVTVNNVFLSATAVAEHVVWINPAGVAISDNNLTKTTTFDGWGDSGAVSTRAITTGDGYVEFTASELTKGRMVGLSRGDTNQMDSDIDFGLLARADGQLVVYENAVLRNGGPVGSYQTGDFLRVAVEGGLVKYRKNGTLLYTSTVTPTYPLLVDTALYHSGGTIKNVVIAGPLQ